MNGSPNIHRETHHEAPVDVGVIECRCGEPAFLITGHFVSWEQCTFCERGRLLAWTSCQTPAIILGEASRVRA